MQTNRLEELIRPLILYMCDIYSFKSKHTEPNEDMIINDINIMLNQIKDKCYSNPMLAQEFSYIEKALVFFIDYTIKEGDFSFSKTWKNLSRKYNELSGDDKFFDILDETLEDPMGNDRVELLYIFMGLGFNGVYKNDLKKIDKKMKQCLGRLSEKLDINKTKISDIKYDELTEKKPKYSKNKILLFSYIAAFVAFFLSLSLNYYVFDENIAYIMQSIDEAVDAVNASYNASSSSSLE
ncbi:MAG TPA: DotU family type IV/VI secretion system protein [Campylobacter avium]|uniref:DotU family type IV/VI secretion system protein n=1 Tax=Campylobacter avium TaxID=522485 RepID=UPI001D2C9DA1|nr:DotU family type IV/VI secretion system protein [Campylobacter avium]HJE65725.1 DotU family type IV/VI secretion system protein [Campylobacter avium]